MARGTKSTGQSPWQSNKIRPDLVTLYGPSGSREAQVAADGRPARLAEISAPNLDLSGWPIMHYTAPAEVSDEEMAQVMEASARVRDFEQRYAMLLDVRLVKEMSPSQRKMIVAGMEGDEERASRLVAGTAPVFSSAFLRGVLTAIFWFKKPGYPLKVFGTPEAALAWCRAQLETAASDAA
jgi:hypothetical protein